LVGNGKADKGEAIGGSILLIYAFVWKRSGRENMEKIKGCYRGQTERRVITSVEGGAKVKGEARGFTWDSVAVDEQGSKGDGD